MTKIKMASECFHAICSSVTLVMGTEMPRAFSEDILWGKKWKKRHESDLLCLGPPICTAILVSWISVLCWLDQCAGWTGSVCSVLCAVCSVCISASVLSTQFL